MKVSRRKRTIIHVNQHVIKANAKTGARDPVLTVKTHNTNTYAHTVEYGSDNRIANLRLATHTENQHNVGVRRDNKTGHKGVRYYSQTGKWIAGIRVDGIHRHLGSFPTKEAAAAAYVAAADELQGQIAAHRRATA